MTINKLPSLFNKLRPVSIGFDNVIDHFERMFDANDEFFCTPTSSFPFYNIVKTGDTTYNIELALAGYSKDEVLVEYADNLLRITSKKADPLNALEHYPEKEGTLHQGIAKRYFSKVFTIADGVEIKGAELKDGLLKVSLNKIIPEGKKPKIITIK
tara:strand:+ start:308 stop:775 length:468 start_codon:yes stop_codon:yes gene_type:complete